MIALALFLLDGIATRVTLLPSDLSNEELHNLSTKSGVKVLISDRSDVVGLGIPLALSVPPVIKQISTTKEKPPSAGILTEWILPTSGTTRTPKLVAHTLKSLARTVKRDRKVGANLRWGLLYDLNRFAGIQVYLQAILGGASLILPRAGAPLEEILTYFAASDCNALSATPTFWRKILMTPGCKKLPLRLISLGGEIADQSILSALASAYPGARVTHIYASTEAGVGFSVTDGLEGFPSAFLKGVLPGVALRISQDNILELKTVTSKQYYLTEDDSLSDASGFINTGDRVRIDYDRVYFLGRDSGAINVGATRYNRRR